MKLFRRQRVFPSRPFELVPGDKLVLNPKTGVLVLVKRSGRKTILNAVVVSSGATEGGVEMGMRMLNHPIAFMALTGVLAASYGLEGSTVECVQDRQGTRFTCTLGVPSGRDSREDLRVA